MSRRDARRWYPYVPGVIVKAHCNITGGGDLPGDETIEDPTDPMYIHGFAGETGVVVDVNDNCPTVRFRRGTTLVVAPEIRFVSVGQAFGIGDTVDTTRGGALVLGTDLGSNGGYLLVQLDDSKRPETISKGMVL